MKTRLTTFCLLTGLLLGLATAAFGQLQWSSYDKNGNLVTYNVGSGGDSTYGGTVSFTIPATTERVFMATNFATITLNSAGAAKVINFTLTANGGLSTGTLGRILGIGLLNDPGTPGNALDDQGYWCDFNTGNPSFEGFYRTNTVTTFFQFDSAHKLNSSTTKTGLPTDGQTYGMQFQLINVSNTGIDIGTTKNYPTAGSVMTNITGTAGTVNQIAFFSENLFTTLSVNSFNEFAVMFNNTTASAVTLTLSGITLVPLDPGISIPPQPYSGAVDSTASFTVAVNTNAFTPLGFQWYETNALGTVALTNGDTANGSTVSGAATFGTTLFTNTLTFSNVQAADAGNLFMVVTNAYGSVTSAPVTMAILPPTAPTNLVVTPADATVIAGQGTNFLVNSLASPTPVYYWFDNNSNLIQSGAVVTLALNNLQPTNGGTYSVIASNNVGTASTNFVITIVVPPCISQQPVPVLVNVGDPVTFSVTEGGCATPAPSYQWYKSAGAAGATAPANAISGATSGSFSISNAALTDIAYYTVVISNSAGTVASTPAKLAIYSPTLTAATPTSPANNATGVCYDTPLYVSFNQPVFVGSTGQIRIFNATNPATPADVIDMSSNTVVVSTLSVAANAYATNNVQPHSPFPGDSQVINYSPMTTSGSNAAIYPHEGVLTSNQTYYVTLDVGVVIDSSGAYFTGLSDTNAWRFTTKVAGPANPTNLVVAADGTGDFLTVQGAVDSVPSGNSSYTLINIRDATYNEIVDISGKNNITFRGQSRHGTVVGYNNNNNLNGSTASRMAFKVNGSDIKIENLTITNSTPQGGSQAEALLIYNSGVRCVVNNCDIGSRQDTILINGSASQGYFYNCRVVGNFDYVWGVGVGYFDTCVFHSLTNIYSSSYNLTAARTLTSGSLSATTPWVNPNGTTYSANGFSFVGCAIESDTGLSTITLAGSNGTAGGLDSWAFCRFDTGYIAPQGLSNSYVFWQYNNHDITGTNPLSFTNVQTIGVTNNDPRLLAATNVPTWFSGWTPLMAPNILINPAGESVAGGGTISLTVSATGIPGPAYQWLQGGVPLGGQTGSTLTITNAHAGNAGNYSVIVSNAAGAAISTPAAVTVSNTAPTLGPISNQTVNVGVTVNVAPTASDPDVPPQVLNFSLATGPTNAAIDPGTGAFSFRPLVSQAASSNFFTMIVADNGSPSLSATQYFSVLVNPLAQPQIGSPAWSGTQFSLSVGGDTGPDYAVQASPDLLNWTTVFATNSPAMPFQWSDPNAGSYTARFYRIVVGPPLP